MAYPEAALFGSCVTSVAYHTLSTVEAASRSAHGERAVKEEVSDYYVAEEVARAHRRVMAAIPEDEWVISRRMTPLRL